MRETKNINVEYNVCDKNECFVRMMSLFQTIPVLTMDVPLKQWQKMYKVSEKTQIKYTVLQDGNERGGLGLLILKLCFTACLIQMKEWMLL